MTNVSDHGTTCAAARLTAWDAQGIHRTATAGDEAGADWLIAETTGLGAAPQVEEFALDRLDPVAAYLKCDGARIPGVPVFDAPGTPAEGVVGALGSEIAVAELSPGSVYTSECEQLRRAAPSRAEADALSRRLLKKKADTAVGVGLFCQCGTVRSRPSRPCRRHAALMASASSRAFRRPLPRS